ncbi:DEAD/DEAH box helicase, partial [Synergistaceae bacterium OttesenSCG-928-I11]|nr:DEAD/DEAH box helicase [Synergistaceae bacterium OttesenSCG-928-I11]
STITYVMDTVPALKSLSGHPYLVDRNGATVEIIVEEPQIHTGSDGDSFVFEIRPQPDEADLARGAAIFEDAPCVLRLVPFGERHVQIARILGANGLRVPASAREDVLRIIGGLASVATIHSDIEGADTGTRAVEPDASLYVQIQPRGDGLDVEAVTRPLGPKSAPCRPGVGEAGIFGMRDGTSASTTRDLEAEAAVLRGFRECCPALARASEISANKWQTTDAETSFEFLTQLQDISDHVTIEWPAGGRRTVKRLNAGAVSLTASALGGRDWFEVSGEIRVDENLVLPLKELLGLMDDSKGRFVRIDGDTFLALTNDFRRRLDELRALGETRGGGVRVHPSAIPLLSKLSEDADTFHADEAWDAAAAKIDEAASLTPQVPSTFRGELRDYQHEGFAWIARLAHWTTGACLADDMGLGKTIQALAFLVARAPQGPSLVVAPTSVCPNWLEEAARFAPTLAMKEFRHGDRKETVERLGPMDVLVASYGLLQSESELLASKEWNAIVLDEAQSIKNMSTKRSAAAMKLNARFKLITTGTPIENNLSELWNLFRFIAPHYLGSHESFNRKFAVAIAGENGAGARRRLRRIIAPFLLRRTKEQVLTELPPKTEVTLRVELYPEERTLYEALRRRAVEEIEAGREDGGDVRFTILAQLTKLRLACCNSALALPEGNEGFRSAKLDAYAEIVSDLRSGGHKALVFSQFVSHLSILKKYLEENDIPFQYLDGSTPPEERKRRVDAFQNGLGDVFLISLKAGGTGLNLTAADYVVHMDPWWNPAVEAQASDRTHRIGQERPVTIYRIVAKETVEEKITDLHAWKRELAESLLSESSTPSKLSADEMLELIRGAE